MSLVARLEVWPHGSESGRFEVGRVKMSNQGEGDLYIENYAYHLSGDWLHFQQRDDPKVIADGKVMFFERAKGGGWKLLYEVLKQVFEPDAA